MKIFVFPVVTVGVIVGIVFFIVGVNFVIVVVVVFLVAVFDDEDDDVTNDLHFFPDRISLSH